MCKGNRCKDFGGGIATIETSPYADGSNSDNTSDLEAAGQSEHVTSKANDQHRFVNYSIEVNKLHD
jgi:hypothetical protein